MKASFFLIFIGTHLLLSGSLYSQLNITTIRDSLELHVYTNDSLVQHFSNLLYKTTPIPDDYRNKVECLQLIASHHLYKANISEYKLTYNESTKFIELLDKSEADYNTLHYENLIISASYKSSQLGSYESALTDLYQAQTIMEKNPDFFENIKLREYRLHYWMSSMYRNQYKYNEAITHMRKAIDSYIAGEKIDDIEKVNDLLQEFQFLANLEKLAGNYEAYTKNMIIAIGKAESLLKNNPTNNIYKIMVRNCFNGHFKFLLERKELETASYYLNKIKTLTKTSQDSLQYFNNRSKLEMSKGNFHLANDILTVALNESQDLSKYNLLSLRRTYIKNLINLEHYDIALNQAEELIKLSIGRDEIDGNLLIDNIIFDQDILGTLELISLLLLSWNKTEITENNKNRINKYAQFSIAYMTNKRKSISAYTDLLNSTNTFRKTLNNYIELYALLEDKENLEIAIEFSKSFTLEFSKIKNQQIQSIKNDSLKREEFYLRNMVIKFEKQILSNNNYNPASLDSLLKYKTLQKELENNYLQKDAIFTQLDQQLVLSKMKNIESNKSYVSYFLLKDKLFIFHKTHDDFEVYTSSNADSLRQYVEKEVQNIKEKKKLQFTSQLSSILIPNSIELKENVVILPHSILNYFPFEILNHQNKSLIEGHNISYVHSISQLNNTPVEDKLSFLGIAPEFSSDCSDFKPLAQSAIEINSISNNFIYKSIKTKKGASLPNFIKLVDSCNVIHLSTHSVINDQNSFETFISFGDTCQEGTINRLYLIDILGLNLNAKMIYLASCQSGNGELIEGEGLTSLAKSFFHSNVKSVIATLWNANDQSSSEINITFYKNLKRGQSKDEALRNAKLIYLKNADPDYRHPYYWAGIIAMGDMQPLFPQRKYYTTIILICCVVLVTIGSIKTKKRIDEKRLAA